MTTILYTKKWLKKYHSVIPLFVLAIFHTSCKKLVEVKSPFTQTTRYSVYSLDANAAAVMTGLYTKLSGSSTSFATGDFSISLVAGLSADEFTLSQTVSNTERLYYYYINGLFTNPTGSPGTEYWDGIYNNIYTCNEAIEGLNTSTTLMPQVKQQLLGEAKFMRAFYYFHLVNLYGAIPLALSSDYQANSRLSRLDEEHVYLQIITDLLEAKELLADHYLGPDALTSTSARLRPTQWAAAALLARVYLYIRDYQNSDIQASAIINNSSLYNLVPLNSVFLSNSKEAIWQLQPVNSGWNTEDAKVFVINDIPSSSKPISISYSLYNSFDSTDKRKISWIKDTTISGVFMPYPYKYKKAKYGESVTEYLMVFRLAEQYLIRAEARARLGDLTRAAADLNVIRQRAGLSAYGGPALQPALLSAILHERQVEFFSEWGTRWFDLKRTGAIDSIMTTACAQKGGTWQGYQKLYPILYTEIQKNKNLIQNTGY